MIQTRQRKFTKRFYMRPAQLNGNNQTAIRRAEIAELIARTVAEDANTAFYVRDYQAGDFPIREDYVEYLANRIEGILAKASII